MTQQRKKFKKYKESDLVYNNKFSLSKYNDINTIKRNSFNTKYDELDTFHRDLDKFNTLES